ncbi:MAG TPA: flagellar FliJ family protein [Microthrixaceae bacterium]|nr:flagellar FliJ family protein [Microthrixaceae bacterium]
MRGYRFRLEPAMRVRKLQEENARARLARARLAADQAMNETSRRRGLLNRDREPRSSDASAHDWNSERDRRDRLAAALRAAQSAEAHALDVALGYQSNWEEAAAELKVLERLDERSREEWRLEQNRAEQKELDELATARSVRRAQELREAESGTR